MVMHSSSQSMLCLIRDQGYKVNLFCTFVYASNNGRETRKLWSNLEQYNQVVSGNAWCMMGDFNVTMKADEHSDGVSYITSEMQEFIDCVTSIEIEDLNRIGV